MNLQGLARVAVALRDAQKDEDLVRRFTMDRWGWVAGYNAITGDIEDIDVKMNAAPRSCGTPACAFGHYAFREDLQDSFELNLNGQITYQGQGEEGGWLGIETAVSHFDLNHWQGEELFGEQGCGRAKRPADAAQYIENFILQNLD